MCHISIFTSSFYFMNALTLLVLAFTDIRNSLNIPEYAIPICLNMLEYAGGQLQCNQVEKASIGCIAGFLGFIGILRWI